MFGHNDQNQQPKDDAGNSGDNSATSDFKAPSLPSVDDSASAPSLPTVAVSASEPIDGDELLHIKQEALQQLSPLVDHLEQSPEEKFRTTMMMIQAADNQGLIKVAYEAAKQIPDEKVRAQALLDIVNEINYFTQQHKD